MAVAIFVKTVIVSLTTEALALNNKADTIKQVGTEPVYQYSFDVFLVLVSNGAK